MAAESHLCRYPFALSRQVSVDGWGSPSLPVEEQDLPRLCHRGVQQRASRRMPEFVKKQ